MDMLAYHRVMEFKQPNRIVTELEPWGGYSVITYNGSKFLNRWDFRTEAEAKEHSRVMARMTGAKIVYRGVAA